MCSSRRGGPASCCSAWAWRGSACTRRCWACWPAPGGGRRTDRWLGMRPVWGGAGAWLVMLVAPRTARAAAQLVAYGDTATFLRGAAHAVAAAGASAILVMGFPVLLKATSGDLGSTGGVVILALTLTRAPLLVPLTAMQGNLIAHFVDQSTERMRALVAPAVVVTGFGLLGVLLAGVFGPWLLREAVGGAYQAEGALLAWLTGAAVAIALLTLTGAAAVAPALHRAYSIGWVSATL